MSEKNCILILGMPGSGASILAGCLRMIGFNTGNAFERSGEETPSVYFRDHDIALAHESILHDLGCRWDMIAALPGGWEESQAAEKAADTLSGILLKQFMNQQAPFAIWDPGLCRLMPLWKKVLQRHNIHYSLIFVLRRPIEVAKILEKTKSLDLLNGHLLWLINNREALAACAGEECLLITFNQFSADPIGTLRNLTCLSGSRDVDLLTHTREILDFVRSGFARLRHAGEEVSEGGSFSYYTRIYDQFVGLQDEIHSSVKTEGTGKVDFASGFLEGASGSQPPTQRFRILPRSAEVIPGLEVIDDLLSVITCITQEGRDETVGTFYARFYFPGADTLDHRSFEKNSMKIYLSPGEWQEISIDIPDPPALRTGRLGLKPFNTLGLVYISGVKLVNAATGMECWSTGGEYSGFSAEKDSLVLAGVDILEVAVTGDDAMLLLPEMPGLPDCPISLRMWIKVSLSQSPLHRYWEEIRVEKKKLRQKELAFSEVKRVLRTKEQGLSTARMDLREKVETLTRLDDQLKEKDQSLQEVRNDLEKQKKLTREYFKALAKVETERVDFIEQIDNLCEEKEQLEEKANALQRQKSQLESWMKHLNRQYLSLINSRRWRVGNAIAKYAGFLIGHPRHAKGIGRMQGIFVSFQKFLRLTNWGGCVGQASVDGRRFIKLMERLQKDFELVMGSRSWRLGNGIVSVASWLIMQKRKPTSILRMKGVFNEFQAWKSNVNPDLLTCQEIKELTCWMDLMKKDFNALFASRRWKLGKALSAPVRFFRQGANPDVVKRVKAVFEEYNG